MLQVANTDYLSMYISSTYVLQGMDIEAKGGSAPGKAPHNTVNTSYSDKLAKKINARQSSAKSCQNAYFNHGFSAENSQPALYDIPDRAESVNSVGAGIWTVSYNLTSIMNGGSAIKFSI